MPNNLIKILIFTAIFISNIIAQNGFNSYLEKDSVYRFNSSLKVMDSLLIFLTQFSNKDTAFNSSFIKSGSLSLSQLMYGAINNNTELDLMQKKIDVLKFQADEKSYLPDPMFEFELDDIMSDFKKVGMVNFYLSQLFPFPGKLNLEKKITENNRTMMQIDLLYKASEIMKMVKMSYYDLYLIERKIELNRDNQQLMTAFLTAAEAQYIVGKGMQQEIFKAQIELGNLKNEEFILAQQKKNILNDLSKLTKYIFNENVKFNFSEIDIGFILSNESFNFNSSSLEKLINFGLENRADVKSIKQKLIMNKSEIELVKLNRMPDLFLKFGYKILPYEEKNGFAVMAGINIPFAPWSSGKYSSSLYKNQAVLTSTLAEYENLKNEIRNEITNIVNNMNSLKESMNYYYNILIPQTENTLKATQYNYESNMTNFLDLLDSYILYQNTKSMFYESLNMYLKSIAELEFATGINLK